MIRRLFTWLGQHVSAKPPPTPAESRRGAEQARHDRAGSIVALRTDIRQLQQEIKDVSDARDTGSVGQERAVLEQRLSALQRRLAQTQADLDKLQGQV